MRVGVIQLFRHDGVEGFLSAARRVYYANINYNKTLFEGDCLSETNSSGRFKVADFGPRPP